MLENTAIPCSPLLSPSKCFQIAQQLQGIWQGLCPFLEKVGYLSRHPLLKEQLLLPCASVSSMPAQVSKP